MDDNEYIRAHLKDILPSSLIPLCTSYITAYNDISEIRLRTGRYITFTSKGRNIITGFLCTRDVFDECVRTLINNSLYKLKDHISNGVIPLSSGFRAGICGTALLDGGRIENIYEYTSINIRFPRSYIGCAQKLSEHIRDRLAPGRGCLVISPPCGGKTTFLRDIARSLSTPPVSERVCVVDKNFELSPLQALPDAQLDILAGYPLERGIDIATKYLSPRYIVCDEIGADADIDAISSALYSGVTFIASAHCASIADMISKPNIYKLIKNKAFSCFALLKRDKDATVVAELYNESDIARYIETDGERVECRSFSCMCDATVDRGISRMV